AGERDDLGEEVEPVVAVAQGAEGGGLDGGEHAAAGRGGRRRLVVHAGSRGERGTARRAGDRRQGTGVRDQQGASRSPSAAQWIAPKCFLRTNAGGSRPPLADCLSPVPCPLSPGLSRTSCGTPHCSSSRP